MASIFKTLTANDSVSSKTLLHEAVPITGTIISGTYANPPSVYSNVKEYAHNQFVSYYDYPYLSSSANHILDTTFGYSPRSTLSSSTSVDNDKKIAVYNQMAQVLMGFDPVGLVREFDEDGDITGGGTKLRECIFISFARLLSKDEIKKGSFEFYYHPSGTVAQIPTTVECVLKDYDGSSTYFSNSPAGEYGVLYSQSVGGEYWPRGLIFYQAGIAVLTGSIFDTEATFGTLDEVPARPNFSAALTGTTITSCSQGFVARTNMINFVNTTELNSRIYFCRLNHNEFNYSSNPTYTSGSQIRVKNNSTDQPFAYITGISLYSADNELLAVSKLSEPILKSSSGELTIRVRNDY
jgi:hypothetical protein